MDAEQFKIFLATQAAQQKQLIEALLTGNKTHEDINNNYAFDNFDTKKEPFQQYIQRLEIYFDLKKIKGDKGKCKAIFLNCIGPECYSIMSNLIAPKSPMEEEYDNLVEILKNHLSPEPNLLVERHRLLTRNQKPNESIADYVAAIRGFVPTCKLNCKGCSASIADTFLLSQFIRGISDNSIRTKLLQAGKLEFKENVEIALASEASKIDCKEIANQNPEQQGDSDVSKITNNRQSRSHSRNRNNQGHNSRHRNQSRPHGRVNYKELGLTGLCLRCARNNHDTSNCKCNKERLHCKQCKKVGHVARVCITTLLNNKRAISTVNSQVNENYIQNVYDVYTNYSRSSNQAGKYYVNIGIEGKHQQFEVDSGAGYTLIPKDTFENLNISNPVTQTNIEFRSYLKEIFKPHGVVTVKATYKDKIITEEMYIVDTGRQALLGRTWIRKLNINLQELDGKKAGELVNEILSTENVEEDIRKLKTKFSEIFEQKVGKIPDFQCSLKLRPDAKPIFHKAREVPFSRREQIEKELNILEQEGIITKVNTSDWGSPLVCIPKPENQVRLCVDYKVGVNKLLEDAHYPIPRIEEILNSLKNSKYFCTLDLFKAYHHVQMDEDSAKIQTITTHKGTYKFNRLAFGIKTAPSEFHRILDQVLQGLEGTSTYFDDIVIQGSNYNECYQRLIDCFDRLKKYNLHINAKKCKFFQTKINYLGYQIEQNKISKAPEKIKAVLEAPRPKNTREVQQFLGLITYYSKFIKDAATLTHPLRLLLHSKVKFRWTAKCEAAFMRLKAEIASDQILLPFDPALPITVSCDASPVGIAGILSQVIQGEEKPVTFISRSLSIAEQNYSQLDREALAIYWTIKRLYMYLYGQKFKLVTDNKPLTHIFKLNRNLPSMTSSRLLRYASFLSEFQYTIEHREAEKQQNVDYFSRAPIDEITVEEDDTDIMNAQTINTISSLTLTSDDIVRETDNDPVLSKLKENLLNGERNDDEYHLHCGTIFRGTRVVVPVSLQNEVLKELHHTHLGICKMKSLARRYVYWKNIDIDITSFAKSCNACAENQKSPRKVETHHWEEPEENFERIHLDYAGPYKGQFFLIVVDAKSKWPEIAITNCSPTTEMTIEKLKSIFSYHGFPRIMVSDNATIFKSEKFINFCSERGIFQKFTAPYNPATNGQAERYVQTFKDKLKAMGNEGGSSADKVREILLRYRATPLNNGKSPAENLFQRKLRIKLDALLPSGHTANKANENIEVKRKLSVGDRVISRNYIGHVKWLPGIVLHKFGRLHYLVKLDTGYQLKRHINQLKSTESEITPSRQQPRVTFNLPVRNPVRQYQPNVTQSRYQSNINNRREESSGIEEFNGNNTSINIPEQEVQPNTSNDLPRRSGRERHPPTYLHDYHLE